MILLQDGFIYDGSLNDGYLGSVLIEKDKIKKIFRHNEVCEKNDEIKIIDCRGKIITPGFIDAHSHNDFFALKKDNLFYYEPFVKQGVSTMVTGNCGFSAAGYEPDSPYNDQVGGGLFSNDGNDYSDFQKWGKSIDKNLPVNLLSLVGHGTLRIGLNGKTSGSLTENQMIQMEKTLEKTLDSGAAGLSLGLMYEPGQFVPFEELERLTKIVKKHNKILTVHARAYSKVSTSYNPPIGGRAHNLRAMDEVVKLTKNTGVKTEYSHLIFVGKSSWSTVKESLQILEKTKEEGLDIGFDTYPMEFGASVITVVLPTWYLSMEKAKRTSKIIQIRLAIEIYMAIMALGFGFKDILISNTFGQMKEIEGKRINEIAKIWKKSNLKTYLEIIEKTDGRVNVLMYKYQNKEIIEALRTHPQSLYMSDAWMEKEASVQNFACYYAFVKFLLLAKNNGTSISESIFKMTKATADRFQIPKRGYIQEGYFADINVIDLDHLNYQENQCNHPTGIEHVIINGKIVVEKNEIIKKDIFYRGRFISI